MGERVLEILIKARDLTATAFGRFRRRLQAVQRVVRTVTRSMALFTAAAVATVAGLTKLGQQGAKVSAVKAAFARTTDNETAALNRLREASRGTVDDFKLMALSNQALALGAARTTDEFAQQVEVVRRVARAQGLAVEEGLQQFVTGMARLSKERLDDLGIQIDQEKANERLAAQLGRQVKSLTDAERATAFRNDAMRQLVALSEDLAGKENVGAEAADRFATAMVNAKNRVAELVAESPQVAAFFDGMTDVVTNLITIASSDANLMREAFASLGRIAAIGFRTAFEGIVQAPGTVIANWLDRVSRGIATKLGVEFKGTPDTGQPGILADAAASLEAELAALRSLAATARASAAARGVAGGGAAPSTIGRMPGGLGPVDVSGLPGITGPAAPGFSFAVDLQSVAQRRGRAAFLKRQAEEAGGIRLAGGLGLTTGVGGVGEELEDASAAFEDAGQVVVGTMFGMAQAAIHGTENIAAAFTGMITQIWQSLPGVGGLLGSVIGGVGALVGAAFTRRDPVPVRMADIDDRAAMKLRESSREPLRITTIIEQGGVEIDRIERELNDRQARDEVVRFNSRGRALGANT